MIAAITLGNARCNLGEGPIWDDLEEKLYFLDIEGKTVHCYDWNSKFDAIRLFSQKPTCIAICEDNSKLLCMEDGIYQFDAHGSFLPVPHKKPIEGVRFNDGKVGPDGRLYAGTIELSGGGVLYRLDRDFSISVLLKEIKVSNGLDWSIDGRTLYFCDTPTYRVDAFDFNQEHGHISNRRTVFEIHPEQGRPDGLTIDMNGMLWLALWGAGCVIQIDPRCGKELMRVVLPVKNVTSCTFAGSALDTLVITTAKEQKGKSNGQDGCVFKVKAPTCGRKSYRFQSSLNKEQAK